MATIKNVNDYYIRSDGSYTEDTNNSGVFYPNSNYSNLLRIYLEDGISENTFVQVNFLIEGKYVTEWLPLFLGTETTKDINGTLITFTEFKMLVPGNILQNASTSETKTIGLSVRMVYGEGWVGTFTNSIMLDAEYTLTDPAEDTETYGSLGEEMADNYALAYCLEDYGSDLSGFYQVQYNEETETYDWTAVTLADSYAETKGYSIGNATLQRGFVNPSGTITIDETVQNALFLHLSNIEQDVSTNTTAIADLDTNKLEKDFTEYTEKTTYSDADTIAINDNEADPVGTPKRVELSNLMKSENVSFDNSGTTTMDSTDVKGAIEELETDIITEKNKIDLHIADETNPHSVNANQVPFSSVKFDSVLVDDALDEVQTNVESNDTDISEIISGTQIVGKATADDDGNDIVDTYETKTNATAERLTKVDKDLSAYNVATLADSQVIYVQDGSNYRKATIGAVKTYIANDFVSFGYVIATADVDGLPDVAEPLTNKIYLVEIAGEEEANNIHNEFIYVDDSWELLGTTQLNLDDIVLSADVTSDGDIGFIEQDQTVSSGTTFQQFVELLLSETYTTQYPTLVAPSVALSVDTVAVVESGTETDVELTATFNAGSIRGDMVGGSWSSSTVQDDRAGDITSYELGVDGFEVDTALINTRTMSSYRFDDGNNIFSVIVNYGIGAQPLDSDGENYDVPLSAGSVEKTRTITGARKLFYGHTNDGLTSSDIRSLESSVLNPSNGTAFTIQVPIGATSVVFAYPATLRSVTSVHQVGVGTALSQFTETEVDVRSAYDDASSEMAYRVYTFEPAEAYLTEESYEVTI